MPSLQGFSRRQRGALLAVMSGKHSVVLVEPEDLWCSDDDEKYRVVLSATGNSAGRYAFGIWARPGESERLQRANR